MKRRALCSILVALAGLAIPAANAQTVLDTSFTYQGELNSSGAPATGAYDFRFTLFDAESGGNQVGPTLCSDDLAVSNGRFLALLDFGTAFAGQKRFLQIEVRSDTGLGCSDTTGYSTLSPRQELTASPNAVFAKTASNAASLDGQVASYFTNAANLNGTLPGGLLSGLYSNALTLSNSANIFAGDGAAMTNLNAANIAAGSLDAARMPTNWAAAGDLSGFYPNPTIAANAVTLEKLAPGVRDVLSSLASTTPLDGVAWGANFDGQCNVPALPAGLTYKTIDGGYYYSLGLRSDGTVVAWGRNDVGQTNVPPLPAGVRYTSVTCGSSHSLAVRSDGGVVAWGSNGSGESNVPTFPPGSTCIAVSAGGTQSLALLSNGTIVAWGTNTGVPALPVGVTYTAIASGSFHSIALRSDGTVVGWGDNSFGQAVLPALPSGVTYTAVACGSIHSLALRSDGTLAAIGNNDFGQTNVPALPGGVTYTAIAAGGINSLALRSNGTVAACGLLGQFDVPGLPAGVTYTAVACGNIHNLALRSGPPAPGSISVAGHSNFAGGITAATFSGNGGLLTNLSASSITGTLASAQIPNLDAAIITSGTLNNSRTTGSSLNTGDTLVLRNASGNFSAGTITAALNGNATSATTATTAATATNSTQLNGQAASFYTNASNLSAGTLTDARLSSNIPLKSAANNFTSTGITSFAGYLGIGTTAPNAQYSLEAVTSFDTQIAVTSGPATGGAISPRTWSIQSSRVSAPLSQITGSFQIIDRTVGASRLLIDTNGNIGLGVVPTTRLTVPGNMNVTGSLAKGGGSFKIDHPLDPENKYLYHSFVESPDMMNVYNGNITTDSRGYATITLPDYFEALNRDFRYQLTVIDQSDDMDVFLWAKVIREVNGNTFTIRSSRGDLKVSWQVTGIRNDAWANKNRIPNSVDKVGPEKGKYLHPEAFDKPASEGIHASPALQDGATASHQ